MMIYSWWWRWRLMAVWQLPPNPCNRDGNFSVNWCFGIWIWLVFFFLVCVDWFVVEGDFLEKTNLIVITNSFVFAKNSYGKRIWILWKVVLCFVLSEISHQSNANQMMDVGVSLQDWEWVWRCVFVCVYGLIMYDVWRSFTVIWPSSSTVTTFVHIPLGCLQDELEFCHTVSCVLAVSI